MENMIKNFIAFLAFIALIFAIHLTVSIYNDNGHDKQINLKIKNQMLINSETMGTITAKEK